VDHVNFESRAGVNAGDASDRMAAALTRPGKESGADSRSLRSPILKAFGFLDSTQDPNDG
jgi:hypothetical protein